MRKAQKEQAEELVKLLGQAHDEITKSIKEQNAPFAMELLGQCQEGAVSLGELIESEEGEDAVTIPILESYCELTYRIYEEIRRKQEEQTQEVKQNQEERQREETTQRQEEKQKEEIKQRQEEQQKEKGRKIQQADVDKISHDMCSALAQIENSVKNDIPLRREVVFLPYKASMWDSLESIWKAAEEDPDCDAYVIPIPYYDKNPDGSFAEMHYEGDEYPDYVPVTWYGDYDFGLRRPDMIFIHNPYDDYNIVTSVHPDFYSKKLKEYTEKLVYVPYFILGEIKPDNKEAVEGMKHFCTVPGVMNADKIIVQSEDMRQVYVNVLSKAAGEHTRNYWRKKILGLGSPKIDKVLCTKKEELDIPEEWLKIIRKPNGEWKKIIFYNTSVGAFLHHEEKMLEKIKDVLKVFRQNRDEVALLWRPHPLMEATVKSMKPWLWEEYQDIVGEYRKEGWGIFDGSAEVERAVMLSDAYYGDMSSVVQLYEKTGKPIMIQDVERIYMCQGTDMFS